MLSFDRMKGAAQIPALFLRITIKTNKLERNITKLFQ